MRTLSLKSILEGVSAYIQSLGLGTRGTNLYIGTMPSTPVKIILVTSSSGPRLKGDPIHRPRVQIQVRDELYSTGIVTAQSIFDNLDHKVISLGTAKTRVRPESEPGNYVRDANDRFIFILNFSLVLAPI